MRLRHILLGIPLRYLVATFFAAVFLVAAFRARERRARRRSEKPRILWGPVPIGGTQYYSRACRLYGYASSTLMYGTSFVNAPNDFDYYPETILPRLSKLPLFGIFAKYFCFLWALGRYDVHFHNFDGGLLTGTLLEYLEVRFWHLAGSKTVVYPYGGDAQIPRLLRSLLFKHALFMDYPQFGHVEALNERRLNHYTKYADFIYASVESVDYLPYWDLLLMQLSAIDTETVNPSSLNSGELRHRFPNKKIIFHAPNHRHIKGTELLIRACEDLKRQGRDDFELVIYEHQPNNVILQAIYDSDIVADSFIMGVYAMFAIEAMALSKPVMCYLRPDLYELYSYHSWATECPIVNTPPGEIKEKLLWLLDHPDDREELGKAGREFVERHHSLKAMGEVYDAIIRKVWYGTNELNAIRK